MWWHFLLRSVLWCVRMCCLVGTKPRQSVEPLVIFFSFDFLFHSEGADNKRFRLICQCEAMLEVQEILLTVNGKIYYAGGKSQKHFDRKTLFCVFL